MNDLTNRNLLITSDRLAGANNNNQQQHHHFTSTKLNECNKKSSSTQNVAYSVNFAAAAMNTIKSSMSSNSISKKDLSSSLMETTTSSNSNTTTTTSTSNSTSTSSKLRLPSFKKLKSKLSIRKSHSTASNLSDLLNKTKLSNSSSVNNFKLVVKKEENTNPNGDGVHPKHVSNGKKQQQQQPVANNKNYIESIEEEEQQIINSNNNHHQHHHTLYQQPPLSNYNSLSGYSTISNSANNKSNALNYINNLTPNVSKENSANHSPKSQYSKVNTPVKHNPITEFLSSLSSSFSLSSSSSSTNNQNNNNNNTLNNSNSVHASTQNDPHDSGGSGTVNTSNVVKMRQKNKLKNEIQKRISLPANYSANLNGNGLNNYLNEAHQHLYSNGKNDQLKENEYEDEPSSEIITQQQYLYHQQQQQQQHQQQLQQQEAAGANSHGGTTKSKIKQNKSSNLLNTKYLAFTSNHQLSSALINGSFDQLSHGTNGSHVNSNPAGNGVGGGNNILVENNKKQAISNGINHIQSYQSLSSVMMNDSKKMVKLSSLMIKPLNRNSRRASMSELGYGKIESYNKLDKLGEGTYATVYKGQSTINGSFVALKEIRLEHEEGAPCTAIREVSLLKQLKHANIVTLHDIIYTEKSLTLVFEYLEKDLKQYMDDCNNIMSIKNIKLFLFQLLRGLAYCHSKQILHRDLKPQNLLINQKGELKLADFGLARAKSIPTKTYSNEVVTLWYRPPDVLLGSTDYSTHIDMWGVGCIFYEMVCGKPLFPGTKVEDELHLIFKTLGSPTEETFPGISTNAEYLSLNLPKFPPFDSSIYYFLVPRLDADGISLLSSYLKYNPKLRASAAESIHHAFFSSFPAEVYSLDNNQSIFDLPNISLNKDPGNKLNNAVLYESCI